MTPAPRQLVTKPGREQKSETAAEASPRARRRLLVSVLVLDEGECGASTDLVLAHTSLS
jgi:hypothetical protein